jgi:flavin reductase (DIM6/NTAB) family NADH-FMN oxidoreductase RutF
MDTLDLRRAFSRFGTGVTVVTTRTPEGRRLGVTANSFNTVSLAPPIVLWSLAERSPSLAGFRSAGRFVVNVLALEQLELAQRFARPAPDKFAGVDCQEGRHRQPVLAGCAASLECRIVGDQRVGDHILFLGEVERFVHAATAPLLFCNGQFQQGVGLNPAPADPVYRPASKGKP